MRATYFPDTDSLYISLIDKPPKESEEVASDTVLDFDEDGNVVGIEIYGNAAKWVDLTEMRLERK